MDGTKHWQPDPKAVPASVPPSMHEAWRAVVRDWPAGKAFDISEALDVMVGRLEREREQVRA